MSIRTTALALALSASFLTSAQAAPASATAIAWHLCKAVGRHASDIGEARNRGVSQARALEVAASAPVPPEGVWWSQGMILYAYAKPHVSPSELFFIGALTCMDNELGGETAAPTPIAPAPAHKLRR